MLFINYVQVISDEDGKFEISVEGESNNALVNFKALSARDISYYQRDYSKEK